MIPKALKDEYYLDKNFFPLKERLLEMLIKDKEYGNLPEEILENIVYDILLAMRNEWDIKKHCFKYA